MIKKICMAFAILIANSGFSQVNYDNFKGEKAKILFSKKFAFAKLYDYKVNASKLDSLVIRPFDLPISENILTKKYADKLSMNNNDKSAFTIILYAKLSIDIENIRHDLIKYKVNEDGEISVMKIIDIVKEDGIWEEKTNGTNELNTLKTVLVSSNVDMLFQFYNKRNNPVYPEINQLKPLVKDAHGVLNIEKLAQIIKENQASLGKYLDE